MKLKVKKTIKSEVETDIELPFYYNYCNMFGKITEKFHQKIVFRYDDLGTGSNRIEDIENIVISIEHSYPHKSLNISFFNMVEKIDEKKFLEIKQIAIDFINFQYYKDLT